MPPRLIITRPLAQALPWLNELQARGADARALPLIDIQPVGDTTALRTAWSQLNVYDALMFVSANAVTYFFAARPAVIPWPTGAIAACTGPGTAMALRLAGVPQAALVLPATEQTQESESLWALLQARDWHGRRVLVVRGDTGREWLAEQWRRAGAEVEFLTAYWRRRPVLDAAGRALLAEVAADPATWIWHFSSAEAVGGLRTLAPSKPWSAGTAWTTHPRIARAALDAGFARVAEISPGLEALLAALDAQGRGERPHLQSER